MSKYAVKVAAGVVEHYRLGIRFDGDPQVLVLSDAEYQALSTDPDLVVTKYIDPPPPQSIFISADAGNAARTGTDGGIFVPAQSGAGAESDILLAIVQDVAPLLN